MKITIIEELQKPQATGVNFIAMSCNTVRVYFKELKNSIKIPLLNSKEETVKRLPNTLQKVNVPATNSIFEAGIYQEGNSQNIIK